MSLTLDRQGDVLIWHTAGFKIPTGTKLKAVKVLHSGNNNDHFVSKGQVVGSDWFEDKKQDGTIVQKMYLRVKKPAVVSHGGARSTESKTERHKDTSLDARDYWVEIQSEMDHVRKLKRAVID